MHQPLSSYYAGRLLLAVLLLTQFSACVDNDNVSIPLVAFENKTQEVGLTRYTPSYSIVVTDIDRDGVDDLFVGNHGFPPILYLNKGLKFVAQPDALPPYLGVRKDRHGFAFADFDNDGDKDFVVAGGGADGIGIGEPNKIYKNLLIETNKLAFIDVTNDSDISNPRGRTRHLHPIASPKGSKVDLYSTGFHQRRIGSKNFYANNNSTPSNIIFNTEKSSSLHQEFASDGKDIFFDFDRDGWVDFLTIGQGRAQLFRNDSGQFTPFPLRPENENISGVISGVFADLNNDGYPDLYLGGAGGPTRSDYIVNNSQEIHFSVQRQADDQVDGMSFRMKPPGLKINFTEHIPSLGKQRTDPTDIFIGAVKKHPKNRKAAFGQVGATGKPESMDRPGIYIWYEREDNLWHVVWKHNQQNSSVSKGIIYSEGIELVKKEQLETVPVRESQDRILINQRGKGWKLLVLEDLKHREWTESLTAADFNNDGFIDIVGLQNQEVGQENGNPFILLNHGDLEFTKQEILENKEDDIFRADLIVHGFFNDDGLPDLFYTNGSGLLPSHVGPYQFWLNTTESPGGYLLLELEGTSANRDAIGAQIELYDMEEKLLGYRELGSNFGRAQNTHKIHFGLGDKKGPFNLKIRWPGSDERQQLLVNKNSFYRVLQN